MSQDSENVLRKSLDAVDQHRRRTLWLFAIASAAVAWEFYRLAAAKLAGDVPGLIVQAVMALVFWILGVAVLIVFQITVATKRILRAIDLASRRAE